MNIKENLKTSLSVIVLMGLLIVPYLMTKKSRDFNPLTLKLNTGVSTHTTLNQLRENHDVILLYFGFLSCPDVCPTTLSKMANVFKDLSPERREKIALVFIDLDPERDKIEDIRNYVAYFDPKIIPVSLNTENLDLITRFFGIAFMKVPVKSEMGYTIDHSTGIVVLSKDSKVLAPISHDSPRSVVTSQLNKIFDQPKETL